MVELLRHHRLVGRRLDRVDVRRHHLGRRDRSRTSHEGVATFSTATVVHFCVALLVSAILSAPWRSLVHAAALLGLTGLYGVVYVSRVMLRTQRLILLCY